MASKEVRDALDRVLSWTEDDQETFVRFVSKVEDWRCGEDAVDGEQPLTAN